VGPTAVLDVSEKRKASCACRKSKHDSLVIQPVAWSINRQDYTGSEYLLLVLVNGKLSSSGTDDKIDHVLNYIQFSKNIRKHFPQVKRWKGTYLVGPAFLEHQTKNQVKK
jgi:hypothetical protein